MKPRKTLCLALVLTLLLPGAALMEVDLSTPAPTQAPAAPLAFTSAICPPSRPMPPMAHTGMETARRS